MRMIFSVFIFHYPAFVKDTKRGPLHLSPSTEQYSRARHTRAEMAPGPDGIRPHYSPGDTAHNHTYSQTMKTNTLSAGARLRGRTRWQAQQRPTRGA